MTFKDLRRGKKVGQKQISNELHCHQSLISKWENGICQPSIGILPKIAKILNCSVEEVVLSFCEKEKKMAQEA
ncbi:MAG: helix-turn-helix transcriptional regulator [Clostridia bacterium]|nr:helix-turn-helix transcriptional regulator [Clostridia bacterium]